MVVAFEVARALPLPPKNGKTSTTYLRSIDPVSSAGSGVSRNKPCLMRLECGLGHSTRRFSCSPMDPLVPFPRVQAPWPLQVSHHVLPLPLVWIAGFLRRV